MTIKFGFSGFRKPTPAKLKKISAFIETVFATVGTSALLASHPTASAILLICAGITNKFFEMFYEEDSNPNRSGDAA